MADVIHIPEVEGDLPLTATTEHQQSKAPTTHAAPSSDCSTISKCQTSQDISSRCGTCNQGTPCHVVVQPSVFSMAEPHRGQSLAPGPFLTLSRATRPPRSVVDAPAVLRETVVLQSCCQIVTSYESLVLALRINRFLEINLLGLPSLLIMCSRSFRLQPVSDKLIRSIKPTYSQA